MTFSLSPGKRFLCCLLSATLVIFSFPNYFEKTLTPSLAFLGWIALVPFFIALQGTRPRQGAFWGYLFGFIQFGGILYWIAFLEAAEYLSGVAWLALVSYLSLYPMLFGWMYRFVIERLKISGMWVAPFLWVGLEYLRGSRPWGGFSWGEIGYSQAPYPSVLTVTTLVGVYGLTLLMVWTSVCVARGLSGPDGESPLPTKRTPRWLFFILPPLLIALVVMAGRSERRIVPVRKVGTVALLQPNVDQSIKWSKKSEDMIYTRIEKLVRSTVLSKPDLIVWPETAAPSYLLITPWDLQRVTSIVKNSKVPQLVGCLDAKRLRPGVISYYNAAVEFDGQGRHKGVYGKRHLVPFGEFVPFQKYLTFLGPVVGDLGSFEPGKSYEKFQAHGFSYAPMICYEVIFPGDVQQAMKTGADALANISNDAWYGKTASPYQHAMMAVVRAAEERKPLVRAANTGICLVTDPFGRIISSTNLFEERVLMTDVLVADSGSTLYSQWGNWFPWFCIGLSVLLFLFGMMKRDRPGSFDPIRSEGSNG